MNQEPRNPLSTVGWAHRVKKRRVFSRGELIFVSHNADHLPWYPPSELELRPRAIDAFDLPHNRMRPPRITESSAYLAFSLERYPRGLRSFACLNYESCNFPVDKTDYCDFPAEHAWYGFRLSGRLVADWEQLEATINKCVEVLTSTTAKPKSIIARFHKYPRPCSRTLRKAHPSWRAAQNAAHRAWQLFRPLLAYLSYFIATFDVNKGGGSDDPDTEESYGRYPLWISELQRANIDRSFIDDLIDSEVGNFREPYSVNTSQRVGCFIDITRDSLLHKDYHRNNVPVWFVFDKKVRQFLESRDFLNFHLPTTEDIHNCNESPPPPLAVRFRGMYKEDEPKSKSGAQEIPTQLSAASPLFSPLPPVRTLPDIDYNDALSHVSLRDDTMDRLSSPSCSPLQVTAPYSPSSHHFPALDSPQLPNVMSNSGQLSGETMKAFFERVAIENARKVKNETRTERQSRVDVGKYAIEYPTFAPPKKVKVFEWSDGGNGVFIRRLICVEEYEVFWQNTRKDQRVYNAVDKCWDVCSKWGSIPEEEKEDEKVEDVTEADEEDSDSDDIDMTNRPKDSGDTLVEQNAEHKAAVLEDCEDSSFDLDVSDFMVEARLILGFLRLLELPGTTAVELDAKEVKKIELLVRRVMGQPDIPLEHQDLPSLSSFIDTIRQSAVPFPTICNQHPDLRWDVLDPAIMGKFGASLRIRPVKSDKVWYRLVFPSEASTLQDWQLWLDCPMAALECTRRVSSGDSYGRDKLVEHLTTHGIAFSTRLGIQPMENIGIRLGSPGDSHGLGYRELGWRPKGLEYARSYASYRERRRQLLANNAKKRAACMAGGIVARLAACEGAIYQSEILAGPSREAFTLGGDRLRIPGDSATYIDDSLSENDIEIICGVYHVFTQKAKKSQKEQVQTESQAWSQVEQLSWWPSQNTWFATLTNCGGWTSGNEIWFQKRLTEIANGKAVPLNATAWKKTLSSGYMSFRKHFKEACGSYLEHQHE